MPAPSGVATRYAIEVTEVLAGAPADRVTLELPGGRLGPLVQRYGGVPLWAPGDEVVVFVPAAGPAMRTGVFELDGDRVVDPVPRPAPVETLDDLRDALHRAVGADRPDRPDSR